MTTTQHLPRHARAHPRRTPTAVDALEPRRLLAGVDLDLSFSGDGKAVTDFAGGSDTARAVAVQADRKVVVAGEAEVPFVGGTHFEFAAVRYNPDGSLDDGAPGDTTPGDRFGTNGKVTLASQDGAGAYAVAIQKDGKVVLAGTSTRIGIAGPVTRWQFMRLKTDGTLDTTFGSGGAASYFTAADADTALNGITLQPDGKIVAVGAQNGNWLVARLNTNGTLDGTFGSGGAVTADWGSDDSAAAVAIDNLGNVVVVGTATPAQRIAVARFLPNGRPDADFSADGRNTVEQQDVSGVGVGSAVVIRPGGDIIAAGQQRVTGGTLDFYGVFRASDGAQTGYQLNFSTALGYTGAAVTVNDGVMLGGTRTRSGNPFGDFLLFDVAANTIGPVDFGAGSATDVGTAVAVAPDGKVVMAGHTNAGGSGRNFAVSRHLGYPAATFGSVGGQVFRDLDGDRVKDANEPGMASIRVYSDANNNGRFDGAGDERDVLTDAAGNYTLAGLAPGARRIRQEVPLTFTQTLPTGGAPHNATVVAGQTLTGRHFGNKPSSTTGAETRIAGSVFDDLDGDGTRDGGDGVDGAEPDLEGRTVYLDLNENGEFDEAEGEPSQVTDAGGNYSFDFIEPGTYRVRTVVPAGWALTAPAAGAFLVTVVGGQNSLGHAFGTRQADSFSTAPRVLAVFAAGSRWGQDFLDQLGGGAGYLIPAGDDQLKSLPWTGIDRIVIRFTQPVIVAREHLAVRGVNIKTYDFADDFGYNPATFTATWALAAPVGIDKLRLELSDGVSNDPPGERAGEAPSIPLDGEYLGTFPSGDGTGGGAFSFRFDVLPGDVDRSGGVVNSIDVQQTRLRQFTGPGSPGTPPNSYSPFFDVNGGGGIVNALDLQLVRIRQFTQLPAGDPAVRSLFDDEEREE